MSRSRERSTKTKCRSLTSTELIDPFYLPGPDNELTQPLIFESAGSVRGPFLTSLGGTVAIINNGTAIEYTPPVDYNAATPDTFTYVVADVPPTGQLVQTAAKSRARCRFRSSRSMTLRESPTTVTKPRKMCR